MLDITKPDSFESHGVNYTAKDWNPITYEQGAKSDSPLLAYRVAKKYAELEAWDAVDPTSEHLRHLGL